MQDNERDEDFELNFLRSRLRVYEDLLEVSFNIIFNTEDKGSKNKIMLERYRNKLNEYGIGGSQSDNRISDR